jgi:hypothetical protein
VKLVSFAVEVGLFQHRVVVDLVWQLRLLVGQRPFRLPLFVVPPSVLLRVSRPVVDVRLLLEPLSVQMLSGPLLVEYKLSGDFPTAAGLRPDGGGSSPDRFSSSQHREAQRYDNRERGVLQGEGSKVHRTQHKDWSATITNLPGPIMVRRYEDELSPNTPPAPDFSGKKAVNPCESQGQRKEARSFPPASLATQQRPAVRPRGLRGLAVAWHSVRGASGPIRALRLCRSDTDHGAAHCYEPPPENPSRTSTAEAFPSKSENTPAPPWSANTGFP